MTRKAIAPIPLWLLLFTSLLVFGLGPSNASAAVCDSSVATAVSVQGSVEVKRVDATQWQPVTLNDTFCTGDRIRVGDRSRADVALANQPVLRLDQNTAIILGGIQKEQTFLVDLVQGATYFFSRATRALDVRTAFVNAGVEGTEGLIRVGDDRTEITIFEGKVVASNDAGTLSLTGGESAVAISGQAPAYRTIVKPRDAVQWALYYPPVMDVPPDDFAGQETNDPRVLAGRAAASLAVGRVDEASNDLERALQIDPKNSDALALQAIIALVQNDKDEARTLAQKAVEADRQSTSGYIALSYAQQARFDLEGARTSLEKAVEVNSNDALAWARLAEVQMGFGEMDEALEAAKKATTLNPNLARTQTVLGFAYLMQVRTGKAREAFNKAHKLDQADALPKLGLGLAKMRDGEVEEGRAELEIAASLDPNNAIVRSYLGKAFFEEKRDDATEREYAIAKELDPKDPTPYFYDALQKQLTNRPVEALQDMEKAIELNDNRAIYRSRMLLDSDLAARSASLARIYRNLGFEQLALVEGWTSVNTDPTNFSAHRFLADTYSALPRHEIARVSELLQSQLLQPINITPIQPSQAVSNQFLLSSLGSGSTSFNEFNTLMVNRDRLTLLTSGLIGGNDTQAGEGVVAGIYKNISFSAGVSNFHTDGWWRSNSDQDDFNVNTFVQVELSPSTSIQGEYRYRDLEIGDLQLNFFRDDFRPNLKRTQQSNLVRGGLRHAFSPNNTILGSFIYQHNKFTDHDSPGFPLTSLVDEFPDLDSYGSEGQYLFRSDPLNIVSGGGYFKLNGTNETTLTFGIPCFGPFPPPSPICPVGPPPQIQASDISEDLHQTNLYAYSYINLIPNVTFTAGLSADWFNTDSPDSKDKTRVNPKFGVIWNPTSSTTIRAAAFRGLKRTLINDQTLEPTQVAGFNQFFDDINATESWRYGGAINQKFSHNIYGGAEFSYRDVEIPFSELNVITGRNRVQDGDGEEYQGRAYLFWTPHPLVALRAEYQYERFNRDDDVAFFFKQMNTHKVPLGVTLFHPAGLSFDLQVTYYNQDGDFRNNSAFADFTHESTDFWLMNMAINYRLPKRYGFITFGGTNIFDEDFKYQETDLRNPTIQPGQFWFGKVTLALP